MLPDDYAIRLMRPADCERIGGICRVVYPHETPYTPAELAAHRAVYPQGQFVAEHVPTGEAVGVHFTLRLAGYHIDDSWDVLTARGTFADHDPGGPTRTAGAWCGRSRDTSSTTRKARTGPP